MRLAEIKSLLSRPAVRSGITVIIGAVVAMLIFRHARSIEWRKVGIAIHDYHSMTLAIAALLTCLNYTLYSCFDLLGRHYIRAKLATRHVMSTAFISYACNLSLGSLIGAIAFRFRLYSKHQLDAGQISKIIAFSMTTNWLGYSVLAGIVFASGSLPLPVGWQLRPDVLQAIGVALLCLPVGYLLLCSFRGRQEIAIRSRRIQVPSFGMAILQLTLGPLHWTLAATVVYVLLDRQIEFATVLGTFLISAIATLVARIPAGLGVVEAVFIGLLRHRIPTAELLAALLVFRAIYHLAPLAVAGMMYLHAELRTKRSARLSQASLEKRNDEMELHSSIRR